MYNVREIQLIELDMLRDFDRICNKHQINYYLAYGSMLGAVREKGFIPWDSDIDICVMFSDYQKIYEVFIDELSEKYEILNPKYNADYEIYFYRIALKNKSHKYIHIDIFPLVPAPKCLSDKIVFMVESYILYKMFFIKRVDVFKWFNKKLIKGLLAFSLKLLILPISENVINKLLLKNAHKYIFDEEGEVYNLCADLSMKEFIPTKWIMETKYVDFEDEKFLILNNYDDYLKRMYGDYFVPQKW